MYMSSAGQGYTLRLSGIHCMLQYILLNSSTIVMAAFAKGHVHISKGIVSQATIRPLALGDQIHCVRPMYFETLVENAFVVPPR